MSIPSYDELIGPLLRLLEGRPGGVSFTTVRDLLAAEVGVTAEERKELLPSGRYPVFANRVGWAHDRLKRAGLSRSIKRGTWGLTQRGLELAAAHPDELPAEMVKQIAKAKAGSTASGGSEEQPDQPDSGGQQGSEREVEHGTPQDVIHTAITDWNQSVAADLIDQILRCSPNFFEHLVLDLLLAMGYGANRKDLQQTGRSGDGGIDGVIALDKLGLEKAYIQAKRYADNTVGSPEIRGFYGALAERKASKGVFITTSSFTRNARETAHRLSDNIVLVDGHHLAQLMIEHEVGCSVKEVVKFVQVDADYFEEVE